MYQIKMSNNIQFVTLISVDVISGDICQQFTREMFDMYQGFASYKNWEFDVLNYTTAEMGKSRFCVYHSFII